MEDVGKLLFRKLIEILVSADVAPYDCGDFIGQFSLLLLFHVVSFLDFSPPMPEDSGDVVELK